MSQGEWITVVIDGIAREAMLFAAVGFLLGGLDDLLVDAAFFARLLAWPFRPGHHADRLDGLPASTDDGRLVVFVAAWHEADVIAPMLRTMAARFGDRHDWRVYVGTYPNDAATIAAVAEVARETAHVRQVTGHHPGPTTKAANLNTLWHRMRHDEAAEGWRAKAIILHDAEDMVHAGELAVFDALIGRHQIVQLPVLPLCARGSPLVSGHYLDEFAESHQKQLVVRRAIGAALPLAGVGCAIARDTLAALAATRGGDPFDAASLTEDYELGLHVAALGGRTTFVRVRDAAGELIAVRAYFPSTVATAVRQKARWMTGIALAGWDRIGWGRWHQLGDHWMRLRDRRAPAAVLVLAAAYLALVLWAASAAIHYARSDQAAPLSAALRTLLSVNLALLGWRLAMRVLFTARAYGWRQGLLSLIRAPVANLIALLAARRALFTYLGMLRGQALVWDKTAHHFPTDEGAVLP